MGARLLECRDGLVEKVAALTFDDGPARWTPSILDLLRQHDALATFFVIGEHVREDGDLLRRILAEGHEVGNHTFSHPRLTERDDSDIRAEVEGATAAIEAVAEFRPSLFRPPYFARDERVDRVVSELGFAQIVLCSIYSHDWRLTSGDAIAENVLGGMTPGAIVALHDGRPRVAPNATASRAPTVEALTQILPALGAAGYRLVTISGLLASR